jgi:hypothetical protein
LIPSTSAVSGLTPFLDPDSTRVRTESDIDPAASFEAILARIQEAKNSQAAAQSQNPVTGSDPVSVLQQALSDAGVSCSAVQMSFEPGVSVYPGGSFNNDQVRVTYGEGQSERFSAALLMQHPEVTVVEIRSRLGFT